MSSLYSLYSYFKMNIQVQHSITLTAEKDSFKERSFFLFCFSVLQVIALQLASIKDWKKSHSSGPSCYLSASTGTFVNTVMNNVYQCFAQQA